MKKFGFVPAVSLAFLGSFSVYGQDIMWDTVHVEAKPPQKFNESLPDGGSKVFNYSFSANDDDTYVTIHPTLIKRALLGSPGWNLGQVEVPWSCRTNVKTGVIQSCTCTIKDNCIMPLTYTGNAYSRKNGLNKFWIPYSYTHSDDGKNQNTYFSVSF